MPSSVFGMGWNVGRIAGLVAIVLFGGAASGFSSPLTALDDATSTGGPSIAQAPSTTTSQPPTPADQSPTAPPLLTTTTTQPPSADLSISVSQPEDDLYTFVVNNSGPSTAAAPVKLSIQFQPSESFFAGSGDGWSCDSSSGSQATCTHPALATQTSSQVNIAVTRGEKCSPYIVTATVSSPTPDPTSQDNQASTNPCAQGPGVTPVSPNALKTPTGGPASSVPPSPTTATVSAHIDAQTLATRSSAATTRSLAATGSDNRALLVGLGLIIVGISAVGFSNCFPLRRRQRTAGR